MSQITQHHYFDSAFIQILFVPPPPKGFFFIQLKCGKCLSVYTFGLVNRGNDTIAGHFFSFLGTQIDCISKCPLQQGVIILQVWGQWDVSRDDVSHFLAGPSKPQTTAHALSPNQRPSGYTLNMVETKATRSLSLQITDEQSHVRVRDSSQTLQKGENVYCVKPLRFQGLSDYQGND